MTKYSYHIFKPYLKENNLTTEKTQIDILSYNKSIALEVLEEFKTIDENEEEFIVKKGSKISWIKPTFVEKRVYLANVEKEYSYKSTWVYLTDSQINYYMTFMYSKMNFLKVDRAYSFEFSQVKKNILKLKTTYNYNSIYSKYKYDSDREKFEKNIWNYIRKIFMWCEDEVITAFFPGIVDSLEKFKALHENIETFDNISCYDYDRAISSLSCFLRETLDTMLEIGKKEVDIENPLDIIEEKRLDFFKNEEKRLEKELKKKEESKKSIDEFDSILSARRELLAQFNKT